MFAGLDSRAKLVGVAVSAGDGSITIGGSSNNPTVSLATAHSNTFTADQVAGASALTSGSAAAFNGGGQIKTVAVNGGTFTITNPSAATTGAVYAIRIAYTTSHGIALGTNFKGASNVTWTATAGAVDWSLWYYNGSTFELIGYNLNAGA